MALVEALLTAIVRADGDALVMHVGERPYVVAGAGTLDLSTQALNLDAMTGILQQLLTSAAQQSLEEFGAAEHRLPPHNEGNFTVVAARSGDDIWIEIRRRRHCALAAVAAPASSATVDEAAVMAQQEPYEVLVDQLPERLRPQAAEAQRPAAAETSMAASLEAVPVALQTSVAMDAPVAPVAHNAAAAVAEPEAPDRARVLQIRIELPPRASIGRGSGVERLLRLARSRTASALFVFSDTRPSIRVGGEIRPLDGEAPMTRAEVEAAVMEIVPEVAKEAVARGDSTEWITDFADLGRVRCVTFTDHRGPGVVVRMIVTRAATAEQLGLSREVQALATEPQGLVLVTGRPGSGKSTLMSALVDLVNHQRAEFIVTLERQVCLIHDSHTAIVSQREIRGGVEEALTAVRASLREDPDVLVVDDLVSAPMVPLLLQAASEGLVFVSITAPSTIDAVERFVDLASADMRTGARAAMAETFRGAVAQVLLTKSDGGRIAAREVLLATAAVTRAITDGPSGQLQAALEGGRQHGMLSLYDALAGLVQSGVVDVREALRKSPDRGRLLAGLEREGIDTSLMEGLG